jgi:hypothetical protein
LNIWKTSREDEFERERIRHETEKKQESIRREDKAKSERIRQEDRREDKERLEQLDKQFRKHVAE